MLALISALVFRQSEADKPKLDYCLTTNIDKVPGCFNALKLASDHNFKELSEDCCKAVYSIFPDTCYLTISPGQFLPINVFKDICKYKRDQIYNF